MSITPTGPLALPLERLRTLLSAVTAFQTFCGAADATAALEHIHLVEFSRDQRAWCLLALGPGWRADRIMQGLGGSGAADGSGTILMRFRRRVAPVGSGGSGGGAITARDAEIGFLNDVGAIILGLINAGGTPQTLQIIGIAALTVAQRSDLDDRAGTPGGTGGGYYQQDFSVAWAGRVA